MNSLRQKFGVGPDVSLFTLGTMRAVDSVDQMYEVIKAAYSAGINHLETAHAYGPAESFLGKALRKLKNEGIEPLGGWVITSKILPELTFTEGQKQLKEILSRLGLKRINNLAIHGINLDCHLDWILKGDGAELMLWAKAENLIDQVGFSSHGKIPLIQKALESNRFSFCSLHLHLLDPERIPLAQKALSRGIGVMAISPADKGGHLHSPSSIFSEDCSPFHPIELAYRFLLAKGISTLTLGACKAQDLNFAKQLKDANYPLNYQEKAALVQLQEKAKLRLGQSQCSQCRQCLPCPKDVPITDLLRLRNIDLGHGLHGFAKERYNLIGQAGHWWESVNASACEECGECLPRCPKELPIPTLLKDIHSRLSATPRRRLWG